MRLRHDKEIDTKNEYLLQKSRKYTETPEGIAEKDHKLSTPRPGTAITRPIENTCGNVCASTSWGCDYSPHREPFVRRKITVATRQRRYRSGSPCPRKASAQSDPRRRLYLLFINKLSLVRSSLRQL